MKKVYLFFLFLSILKLRAQETEWLHTSNWKLYYTHGNKSYNIPIDTIVGFRYKILDTDTIQYFLSGATRILAGHDPTWMGHYLASCKTKDGELKVIYISVYGGFFWDSQQKIYYTLPTDRKDEWLHYLTQSELFLENSQ